MSEQQDGNRSARRAPRRKKVIAALVVAAGVGGLGLAAALPAEAGTSVMATDWHPQLTPWSTAGAYWNAPRNSSVTMTCWTTGPNQLGTAKWFHINTNFYPFRDGFVPANAVKVSTQSVVGHC